MDRRTFLKTAGLAGLSCWTPVGSRTARAQSESEPYTGLFFVMVNAGGGWDPTSLCDPKGRVDESEADPMNMYFTGDIGQAGNIRYAPVAGNQAFFDKYFSRLLILNGVDTQTNGHDSGSRHTWSGRLAEGYPSVAALLAGGLAPTKPLAFVSNGGYDVTAGLVAPTRTGNTGVLSSIAFPNLRDTNNAESVYHHETTLARIREAQRARLESRMARQNLPPLRRAMNALFLARSGENEIRRLTEFLPELDNSGNSLFRQAQLALASYRAGLSVSANLSVGGFDTHGDHDNRHFPALQRVTEGVDFLMEEAERQGVADRVVVVVGSDFGRTPGYNSDNGKDHWSITSMMLMGPGIAGNRVIGSTDERHRPHTVNAESLERDDAGIRLKPGHVHRALRKLAGLDGSTTDRNFPLADEDLPLFGSTG